MGNAEQIEYWNGEAGQRWAQDDDTMARLLRPVCEALLAHADTRGCSSAVDVGCGGGSQTIMLAQQLGERARVLGVDISGPMLQVARDKAALPSPDRARVDFLQADASTHSFAPASFDLLFSRFGVMFFDDPVAAFTNLRNAMRARGRLAFCCWQALRDNAWTLLPVQAALQHLPPPEAPDPHAPGPFAFADPARVTGILAAAGFTDIAVEPFTTRLRIGEGATLGQSVRELARIGPVARLLVDQDEAVLEKVFTSMEQVLDPHYQGDALELPCAIWFVTAAVA